MWSLGTRHNHSISFPKVDTATKQHCVFHGLSLQGSSSGKWPLQWADFEDQVGGQGIQGRGSLHIEKEQKWELEVITQCGHLKRKTLQCNHIHHFYHLTPYKAPACSMGLLCTRYFSCGDSRSATHGIGFWQRRPPVIPSPSWAYPPVPFSLHSGMPPMPSCHPSHAAGALTATFFASLFMPCGMFLTPTAGAAMVHSLG